MSLIKNTINLYRLNTVQQKNLKMYLNKLNLHNKLMLTLNKKIEKFPHNKINDKLNGSLNQNIIFNFSNKNNIMDRRFINNNLNTIGSVSQNSLINNISLFTKNKNFGKNVIKLLRIKNSELGRLNINNKNRLSITTNVIKIITSFFKDMLCLINRPQFIHKPDKLIVRIFFNQNNLNKDVLFNNKINFIYNLFNGTNVAKAQYNAPKSQNFAAILKNMLGQTKWNKTAQTIFKNNDLINTLELANISKKIFTLFIKDLMNLLMYNKKLSIEEALIQLQKGVPINNSLFLKKKPNNLIELKKHNQLLLKLINSTNSESLNKKRTRLSKIFFNKSLLAKLTQKIYIHNNNINNVINSNLNSKNNIISTKELVGKGLLLKPVNKKKLDTLLALSNLNLSDDYRTIATAFLLLLNTNKIDNSLKLSNLELSKKIYKNLFLLSNELFEELNKKINFIYQNLLPNLLNYEETEIINSNKYLMKLNKFENYIISSLYKSYILKIIKLINKHLGNNLIKQNDDKTLISIKEALMAYNYSNANTNILNSLNNVIKLKSLGILLTKIFKKNIDIQLIKLHNAGLETEILSKIIALNARETKTSILFKKIWRKIIISKASLIHFKKQNNILNGNTSAYNMKLTNDLTIPVFSKSNNKKEIGVKKIELLSNIQKNIKIAQLQDQMKSIQLLNSNPLTIGKSVGLFIKIAGRLQKDPIKPKQTVKTISVGNFSKKYSNTTSLSSFTSKNKKGTFRITIKMSHCRTFSTSASNQFKIY